MKINKNNRLTGIWSGYDSVNKIINGGLYNFQPKIKTEISSINRLHFGSIIDIAEKQLGKNYITESTLIDAIENNIGLVSLLNQKGKSIVTGFATGKLIKHNEVLKIFNNDSSLLPQVMMPSLNFGFIQSVAVNPQYSKMGIGQDLVSHLDIELQKKGANIILSIAWKNGDTVNISGVLKSLGYTESVIINNYWYDDSQKNKYFCPRCGNPCSCSAVIYYKIV